MRLIDADALIGELNNTYLYGGEARSAVYEKIGEQPTINAVEVVRCKDCKHYELDYWAKVNGIPLIVAHHICKRWGEGCKTDENGFCFMGEKVTE